MDVLVCARTTPEFLVWILEQGHQVRLTSPHGLAAALDDATPDLVVLQLPACEVHLPQLVRERRDRSLVLGIASNADVAEQLREHDPDEVLTEPLGRDDFERCLRDLSQRARVPHWPAMAADQSSDLDLLMDTAQFGLAVLDEDGRIVLSNRGMQRIFGYTEEELRQLHTIEEIVAPAERPIIRRARERLTQNLSQSLGAFWRWVDRSGNFVDIEVNATGIERDGGRRGLLLELREVGEELMLRDEASAEARRTQRDQAAGALIADLAVQLEQLNSLFQNGRVIAARSSDRRRMADVIARGTDTVRLLRPMLDPDFSGEAEIDPAGVAYRAFALSREVTDPRVKLDIRVNQNPPRLNLDRSSVEEVLSHLLLLVREAVAAQLATALEAYRPAISLIVEPVEPLGGGPPTQVLIAVDHNGRRRGQDLEAGLDILQSRLAGLGGSLRAQASSMGQRISVLLPVGRRGTPTTAAGAARSGDTPPSILLVEDDIQVHELAGAAFGALDASVTGVTSCEAALRVLAQERFDIVLLAVDLPGTNGWQSLARLRAEGVSAPVVMLGRFASAEDAQRAGAQALVEDPLNVRDLVSVVRQTLARA